MLDQDALIAMFARLAKEISGLITTELKRSEIDLTKSQAIVLSKLVCRDGCAQNDLALITARDKTSLTRLLSTMERKALITRKKSKEDGRVKKVSITELGKSEFQRAQPIIQKILRQAESGIASSDLEHTKEIILKIYNNLNLEYEK